MRLPQLILFAATVLCTTSANAQNLVSAVSAPSTVDARPYAFADSSNAARLSKVFSPPEHFKSIVVPNGSYAAWLRGLPIRTDRQHVFSYRGERLKSPSAGIVAIDVGDKNLQQCADSAIRLHAEYLWAQGRSAELAYHFTSGDEVTYSDWVRGERIIVDGARVRRVRGAKRADNHASMREWLDLVFRYAGTRSLSRDSVAVSPSEAQPGDFFVSPGSPGHAVVILDVAIAPDGRRVALIGQGFMPAQEFHVLDGSKADAIDGVWFPLPRTADDTIRTPSWKPFRGADLRRFTR